MNAEQAKRISLPDLMARLGHEPVKFSKGGYEVWYASPFRAEKDASFHTSFLGGKWIWNDFGDTGGTVIDFAMRYKGFRQVREALAWLEEMMRQNIIRMESERVGETPAPSTPDLFSSQPQPVTETTDFHQLQLIKAIPLTHPAIIEYLTKERGISEKLARHYLREIHYRNTATGKDFFAFGMQNESEGYEIRVASSKYSFKSALIARDISVIAGTTPEKGMVNVFEGMTDFLSLLMMMNAENLSGDSLILHSLSSYPKAEEYMKRRSYRVINTFLDNDRAGQEGTARFQAVFGEKISPQNQMFAPYKDLNEALCATLSKGSTS